jgi:hypothetical protein
LTGNGGYDVGLLAWAGSGIGMQPRPSETDLAIGKSKMGSPKHYYGADAAWGDANF